MKGNVNPKVEILERDKNFYHVKMVTIMVNPKDPLHPTSKEEVKSFRYKDYQRIFGGSEERRQHFKKVIGFDSAELVHDPSLNKSVKEEEEETPVKIIRQEQQKIKEARLNEEEYMIAKKITKPRARRVK